MWCFSFFLAKRRPSRAGKTLTHFAVDHSAGVRMSVCEWPTKCVCTQLEAALAGLQVA